MNPDSGKKTIFSVPQTTNTPKICLIVVVPIHILVVVVHVAVVSVVTIVLASTPPIAVVADIVEIATTISVATRQHMHLQSLVKNDNRFKIKISPLRF